MSSVKARVLARLGGLSLAVLLVLSAAQSAQADTLVAGTNVWTMVGNPSFITSGANPIAEVSFSNHASVAVTGIVLMVLRNNASQMVYYSTGTVNIANGAIGVAGLIEFGQPPGLYNATFFAMTFAGVAISLPYSVPFTVP
jgi:hypothetical protein